MTITVKKSNSLVAPIPGSSNAKFYGFGYADGKRIGTVWKFNGGYYVFNEDFDRKVHGKDNRPKQCKGKTLAVLKQSIKEVL